MTTLASQGDTALFDLEGQPPSTAERGAVISDDGQYRYRLWRRWNDTEPSCWFIMLNPSTADAEQDDPTIRRCCGFARSWGYGGIFVVNVYAYRATNPSALSQVSDPFGPMNGAYLLDALRGPLAIAAWGAHPGATARFREWYAGLPSWQRGRPDLLMCLGRTKDGHPRHPLYVRGDVIAEHYGAVG